MQNAVPPCYAGKILRVDLSHQHVWTEPWTPDMARTYLGGVGLGAKILWEEVPAEVSWDHPENRLVLATGPMAGLPAWGTGGLTVVTRGALTKLGVDVGGNTPEEMAAYIKSEIPKWAAIIKASGTKIE